MAHFSFALLFTPNTHGFIQVSISVTHSCLSYCGRSITVWQTHNETTTLCIFTIQNETKRNSNNNNENEKMEKSHIQAHCLHTEHHTPCYAVPRASKQTSGSNFRSHIFLLFSLFETPQSETIQTPHNTYRTNIASAHKIFNGFYRFSSLIFTSLMLYLYLSLSHSLTWKFRKGGKHLCSFHTFIFCSFTLTFSLSCRS